MFNSVRNLESVPGYRSAPAPQMFGVAFKGESVIDVPIKRQLVDNRVKFASTHAIDLAANGSKYSRVSISPSIEEVHEALNIVRKIDNDAQYRAQLEAALNQPAQESPQESPQESSQKPAN